MAAPPPGSDPPPPYAPGPGFGEKSGGPPPYPPGPGGPSGEALRWELVRFLCIALGAAPHGREKPGKHVSTCLLSRYGGDAAARVPSSAGLSSTARLSSTTRLSPTARLSSTAGLSFSTGIPTRPWTYCLSGACHGSGCSGESPCQCCCLCRLALFLRLSLNSYHVYNPSSR